MVTFKEFIHLAEGVTYSHISAEEDWEHAEQAYQIAKLCRINPGRDKEPTIVALDERGQVVGAAFTSWSEDHEQTQHYGEPVNQWQFDVVVHPQYQWGRQIGMTLIQMAEKERHNLEAEYGQKAYTRLWVVNPKLARHLQNYHGYEGDTYGDGSATLYKY